MESLKQPTALVSGASIAGLTTAYWLSKAGYQVTIVELADAPRTGGAAVNVGGPALDCVRRMGIYEQLKAQALTLEQWEFKDADDATAGLMELQADGGEPRPEDLEIERDKLIGTLRGALPASVEFRLGTRIVALTEAAAGVEATLQDGTRRLFDLVIGCDGLHSGVRKLWFGHEAEYSRFLQHYFSLTIVPKLLLRQHTAQLHNVPGKVIMLNAYNGKTDIVFCFFSEKEIPYDYRDAGQQAALVAKQFAGQGWRTAELLAEVQGAQTAYFDKFCQIIMPSWTKGRVALVGDAGSCPSPASGMGASLAILGATTLADALAEHGGNVELAFAAYDQALRPFIEEVQATALTMLNHFLIPGTEEAIQQRNAQPMPF